MRSITQLRRSSARSRVAEGMVVVRPLGQRREIGRLRERQLVHRLVEIVERGGGDAVGAEAEEDLVEVELEDLVLGVGLLDAEREDRFLDLAVERLLVGEQEVLGDLLGDGRGAAADAARCRIACDGQRPRRARCRR